jgi:hypothetical protein
MEVEQTERYRAFDVTRFSLGDNRELVYSPLSRAARTVPAWSARLLQGCRSFATLDEHATRLCQELHLPLGQRPQVRDELCALAEAGLLISAASLLAACARRPGEPETPPPVASLGIPTRNRVEALERCLASYVEAGFRHGRTVDYVIGDDSEHAETRRANCRVLEQLRDRYGVAMYYAGPEERSRFADTLCRHAGLPADVVSFGLLPGADHPVATGANRNALLLHAVGDMGLQVDDDTVCSVAPAPEAHGGLHLSSQPDPTQFWFFAQDEPVLPPGGFRDEDFLALHERLLGKEVGACLASRTASADRDLEAANTGFFRKLQAGTGRVAVTAAGVVGDSGMASAVYLLTLEGASRERLLASERVYRSTLAGHQLMRAAPQATLCDGAFCMALNLGLDNRRLLPPFMPVGRNQDGIFAAILRSCFPGALQGFLPWMVQHQPPQRRRPGSVTLGQSAARVSSGQVIQALVGSFVPGPDWRDARANLRALGKTLKELGRAARADFEEVVRLHLWNQMSGLASRLAAQLNKYGRQPGFWANDVRQILAALEEALPDPHYPLPFDLSPAPGDDPPAVLQRLIARFGGLLEIWPDMIEAARELRSRNVRLARRV